MIKFKLQNDKYEIEIPSLAFGTASFEKQDNDEEYFPFLDTYVKLGGNCIDTARTYCSWLEGGDGSSEKTIGRWLTARNNRKDVVIVTKGGHHAWVDGERVSRLTREELEKDLQASLDALQTDYIDIYLLHRDDESTPVEEIMPVLDDFVKSGKVHFIGASNWKTERIEKANDFAVKNGMEPFRISQIYYSLAHTSKEAIADSTIACMDTKS